MNITTKIAVMGSWNTDGGVSRHTTPIVEWLRDHCYDVRVFTNYKKSSHGFPLDTEDEPFVYRCFTTMGKRVENLEPFNTSLLLNAIERESYNIFLAEDLGILPMEDLLDIFPRIKKKAKAVLINHDNKPKSSDSLFWQFDWDIIINFLPEQNEFMKKYYSESRIISIEFPVYPISQGNTRRAQNNLQLPVDRDIILTFGEYNMVDFVPALSELKKDEPSIYLIALVYDEKGKKELEAKTAQLGVGIGYDEIRPEASSWQKRREYIFASQMVILDKGKGVIGSGAVLSSTAHQVLSWGVPILARENLFFSTFKNGEVIKYKNDEESKRNVRLILHNDSLKERTIRCAHDFCLNHSPEKITTKLLDVFNELLGN